MPRSVIVLVLLIGVVAGCQDPYQQDRAQDRRSPARAKPALPETPHGDNVSSRAPARDSAPTIEAVARATPRSAVKVFCSQWTNWSWRTIGRQQRRLAALATGLLGRELAAEAQVRVQDQALRRDRLGARGHVVAIDVKRRGSATRRAVCVAWEQQLTDSRADQMGARHHVYLVTVARMRDGWAVSQWQPQP
jgi:hypothetical protein